LTRNSQSFLFSKNEEGDIPELPDVGENKLTSLKLVSGKMKENDPDDDHENDDDNPDDVKVNSLKLVR
jgi:hypothetical protein